MPGAKQQIVREVEAARLQPLSMRTRAAVIASASSKHATHRASDDSVRPNGKTFREDKFHWPPFVSQIPDADQFMVEPKRIRTNSNIDPLRYVS